MCVAIDSEEEIPMFTSTDVLKRALENVKAGPFSGRSRKYIDHGDWCPRCFISSAKSDLDREHDTWGENDMALLGAAAGIKCFEGELTEETQSAAVSIIEAALMTADDSES